MALFVINPLELGTPLLIGIIMLQIPVKIAVVYAFIGALWILLSDWLLRILVSDPALFSRASTFKGWAFIAFTTAVLYRMVARDHAERKRISDSIRERETYLQNVLETLPVGVWLLDREGNITYGNPAGQKIWEGKRFVGIDQFHEYKGWRLATGTQIVAEEWGAARAITKGETSLDEEIEIECFDGTRKIILHSAVPVRNEQHEIVSAVIVNQDITELKRREEEQRRLQEERDQLLERLQLQFERMPIGCFITDRDTRFIDWNPAAEAILGFKREEVLGKRSMELIIPPEARPFLEGVIERLLSGDMTAHATNENMTKDGRTIICEWYNTPLRRGDGEITHILSMFRDVTERKRTEREIAAYQEQLRFMASEMSLIEERQRRDIATVLHDQIGQVLALAKIKLGGMKEAASAGKRSRETDEIRELLDQAIRSSRSLTFDISPPILYELGFEAAVQTLCEKIQQQHGIRLKFSSDREPKPLHDYVVVFLFQAVRELLVNIVKHARAGNVQVSCRRNDRQIVIVVADDGSGFDTSPTVSQSPGNRSFGLFSIRERLYYLGGEMAVDSAPGRGTRVTLVAPLKESIEEGAAQ
jgi:PAS domain S-box-containing protein